MHEMNDMKQHAMNEWTVETDALKLINEMKWIEMNESKRMKWNEMKRIKRHEMK